MRDRTTLRVRDHYAGDGFVVVEHFLGEGELETWREVVEDAIAARGRQRFFVATGESEGEELETYYSCVFTQRVNLWQTSEARELLVAPLLGGVVGVDGLRIWTQSAASPTALRLG